MNKIYKCPFDRLKFDSKESFFSHLETEHNDMIPKGMSTSQYWFNYRNKKDHGSCVICGKTTKWNENSERYDRFCSDKCKDIYVENFKKNMKNKYGKEHLLDDPEHQKMMLKNRSISGEYIWSDGSSIAYTGSYERDFLQFLDILLHWNSTDIMECPHYFKYKVQLHNAPLTEHTYIPDFFIPSLNLVIEIKDGGDNPNKHHKIQDVDKQKEKEKDKVMMNQKKFNYIKITDKKYKIFIDFLLELKEKTIKYGTNFKPIFMLGENFDMIFNNIINEYNFDDMVTKQINTNNKTYLIVTEDIIGVSFDISLNEVININNNNKFTIDSIDSDFKLYELKGEYQKDVQIDISNNMISEGLNFIFENDEINKDFIIEHGIFNSKTYDCEDYVLNDLNLSLL